MKRVLSNATRSIAAVSARTDAQLLDAFVADRDPLAFELLVRRYAGLVLGVCRRVLRHHHDAEDAFQATFLVLARRAADVWPQDAVGNWLYGVAYRVALKARTARARQDRGREPLADHPAPEPRPDSCSDLAEVIDRAVRQLPERYRAAVILCDLEGRSQKEAAGRLGWKLGTLSGRLTRARRMLARKLAQLGSAVPAGGLVGTAADAAVPEPLIRRVVEFAGIGGEALTGPVAELTRGVIQTMYWAKFKLFVAAALVVLAGAGVGWTAGAGGRPLGDDPPSAGQKRRPAQPAADDERARSKLAEADFEKTKAILAAAEAQRMQSFARLRQAEADVKLAEATVAVAREQVRRAEAQLAEATRSAKPRPPRGPHYTVLIREVTKPERAVAQPLDGPITAGQALAKLDNVETTGADLWVVRPDDRGGTEVIPVLWANVPDRPARMNQRLRAGDTLVIQFRPEARPKE